ncbi:MAG: hypothetical protein Kow0059_22170 [Candidatus Sumerlaeia bacterium]
MTDWEYIQRQRSYWENNLDPDNIGHRGQTVIPPREVAQRLKFYGRSPHLRHVRKLMGAVEGRRILELGGGMSVQPLILAQLGADVWVADVSIRRLAALQRLARQWGVDVGLHCVTAPAEALPFAGETFDIVTTNAVLIHTRLEDASREIHRVLRRGGRAILSEPTGGHPVANLYRRTLAPREWRPLTRYLSATRFAEVGRLFTEYRVDYFYLLGFFAFVWEFAVPSPGFFRVSLAVTQPVDRTLFTLVPALRRMAWFGVLCGVK